MKHLVIAAHPRVDSLTMSLAHAYVAELAALGHQHTLYDLYSMGFDPLLTGSEMAQPQSLSRSPVVLQAQQDLEAADAVTVVYPLWWLSMPAILKGYIDRVFARGFAYESRQGVVHGLPVPSGRRRLSFWTATPRAGVAQCPRTKPMTRRSSWLIAASTA